MRTPALLLLPALLAATGPRAASAAEGAVDLQLAAVYDLAALGARSGERSDFTWRPWAGMEEFCGPARRPVGLGVFEAVAMASGLTPTLAVLVEQTGEQRVRLGPEHLRVAVGTKDVKVLLQPAVEAASMVVRIEGDGDSASRYEQLVRTQLEIELCMEHKLGRSWTGGPTHRLREAFMLDPPDASEGGRDRMYFGGQGLPVAALLGPPDACFDPATDLSGGPGSRAVVGGIDLVPSDVWSSGLRTCGPKERAGDPVPDDRSLPLQLSLPELPPDPPPSRRRRELVVKVYGDRDPDRVAIDVQVDGERILSERLFQRTGATAEGGEAAGLVDVLARVPRTYPTLGPPDDPGRYTLLLVPEWQVASALKELSLVPDWDPELGPEPPADGVTTLLARPELLFVQVPGEGDDSWPDLSSSMGPGPKRLRQWGYLVGYAAGRSPIALPGEERPTWKLQAAAQRAAPQASFLLSLGVLIVAVLGGLRRLPELWSRVPEVAVDYWPGLPVEQDGKSNLEDATDAAVRMGGG